MARKRIGVRDLNLALEEILLDYGDLANEEIRKAAKESAKQAVEKLRMTSPEGEGSKKGHYKEGWAISEEKSKYKTGFTVYNNKKPGLAHLLEHGHAKRGGGRVAAKVHIAPVETQAVREFEAELRRRLSE